MTLVDHLLVLGLVVLWPILALRGFRNFLRNVAAGMPDPRQKLYRRSIAMQWAWAAGVFCWWLVEGRAPGELGLGFGPGTPTIIAAVLTVFALMTMVDQVDAIRKLEPARLEKLRAGLGDAAQLLPTTDGEHRTFRAVAATAGMCEELLYRGYLIWYLGAATGRWQAVLLSALVFGAAHSYQGAKGAVRAGLIGLVMGAVYLTTGSLVWPMLLHAAIDLHAGELGRAIHKSATPAPA